jgi:hypothetical protein
MKLIPGLAALSLAVAVASQGRADPRLDEKVYDPYVHNGVAELEVRGGQVEGGPLGGATTTVMELEYGLSDRVSLALLGAVAREPGGEARVTDIGLESVVYLGQIPGIGVDTGLYFEYGHGLNGEPDFFEGKVLLAKNYKRFQGLLNLIVEEPVGAPSGEDFASYGYAASATLQAIGKLRLGAEAVGDFGDDHAFGGRQGAYVGPQVKWEGRLGRSPVELEIDAGWLAAVGKSQDEAGSQIRFSVELERRF